MNIKRQSRTFHCHFVCPNGVNGWNVEYKRFGRATATGYIHRAKLFMINLNTGTVCHRRGKQDWKVYSLPIYCTFSACVSVVFVFCLRIFFRDLPFMRSQNTCGLSSSDTALQWNSDKTDSPKAFSLVCETNTGCIVSYRAREITIWSLLWDVL